MPATVALFDSARSVAFSSITNSYTKVGTPFGHLMRIIHFVNNTNADMWFSYDGTTNNVYVPANSFTLYDIQTNGETSNSFTFQLNTQIYVKYAVGAPTSGSVYVMTMYGRGQ